ncbi:MAG: hypothetical protein KAZ30_02665 [Candidatus Magasanikbacteria bacterium]|nr:hypothetical protein [Candidatus Magasanikbacteria bacterium]
MPTTDILKDLGLTPPEIEVYTALLQLGGARASTVARETGLKRTTIYAILKSLARKGFVAMYLRHNAQLYYAERPERVKHYFEKKLSAFAELIPSLETLAKKNLKIEGIRPIETISELKLFYQNILLEYKQKSYSIIGNTGSWTGYDPDFFAHYRHDRATAKIKTRLLLTSDSEPKNDFDNQKLLRVIKYLPPKYKFNSTIDIFDDKILIISPELSALAVVIAISPMVDVFKMVFEMLWDWAPQLTSPKKPLSPQP